MPPRKAQSIENTGPRRRSARLAPTENVPVVAPPGPTLSKSAKTTDSDSKVDTDSQKPKKETKKSDTGLKSKTTATSASRPNRNTRGSKPGKPSEVFEYGEHSNKPTANKSDAARKGNDHKDNGIDTQPPSKKSAPKKRNTVKSDPPPGVDEDELDDDNIEPPRKEPARTKSNVARKGKYDGIELLRKKSTTAITKTASTAREVKDLDVELHDKTPDAARNIEHDDVQLSHDKLPTAKSSPSSSRKKSSAARDDGQRKHRNRDVELPRDEAEDEDDEAEPPRKKSSAAKTRDDDEAEVDDNEVERMNTDVGGDVDEGRFVEDEDDGLETFMRNKYAGTMQGTLYSLNDDGPYFTGKERSSPSGRKTDPKSSPVQRIKPNGAPVARRHTKQIQQELADSARASALKDMKSRKEAMAQQLVDRQLYSETDQAHKNTSRDRDHENTRDPRREDEDEDARDRKHGREDAGEDEGEDGPRNNKAREREQARDRDHDRRREGADVPRNNKARDRDCDDTRGRWREGDDVRRDDVQPRKYKAHDEGRVLDNQRKRKDDLSDDDDDDEDRSPRKNRRKARNVRSDTDGDGDQEDEGADDNGAPAGPRSRADNFKGDGSSLVGRPISHWRKYGSIKGSYNQFDLTLNMSDYNRKSVKDCDPTDLFYAAARKAAYDLANDTLDKRAHGYANTVNDLKRERKQEKLAAMNRGKTAPKARKARESNKAEDGNKGEVEGVSHDAQRSLSPTPEPQRKNHLASRGSPPGEPQPHNRGADRTADGKRKRLVTDSDDEHGSRRSASGSSRVHEAEQEDEQERRIAKHRRLQREPSDGDVIEITD
ncbi:hypothetical protein AURDEDRAFT_128744 [Auricularia subglabra TFB-10046 SS5]|nr:hypothetical protein AURDEDRAFT_128744 [Auricularia subglabra TFB-10046 SS5]